MNPTKLIPVYVTVPGKGTVKHGEIDGSRFVRHINGDYVRWSEKSFCINTTAMPKLMEHNVYTLQFRYRMAEQLKIYEYPISLLNKCAVITNEHGEEDIRIPIENCKLVKTIKFGGAENGKR